MWEMRLLHRGRGRKLPKQATEQCVLLDKRNILRITGECAEHLVISPKTVLLRQPLDSWSVEVIRKEGRLLISADKRLYELESSAGCLSLRPAEGAADGRDAVLFKCKEPTGRRSVVYAGYLFTFSMGVVEVAETRTGNIVLRIGGGIRTAFVSDGYFFQVTHDGVLRVFKIEAKGSLRLRHRWTHAEVVADTSANKEKDWPIDLFALVLGASLVVVRIFEKTMDVTDISWRIACKGAIPHPQGLLPAACVRFRRECTAKFQPGSAQAPPVSKTKEQSRGQEEAVFFRYRIGKGKELVRECISAEVPPGAADVRAGAHGRTTPVAYIKVSAPENDACYSERGASKGVEAEQIFPSATAFLHSGFLCGEGNTVVLAGGALSGAFSLPPYSAVRSVHSAPMSDKGEAFSAVAVHTADGKLWMLKVARQGQFEVLGRTFCRSFPSHIEVLDASSVLTVGEDRRAVTVWASGHGEFLIPALRKRFPSTISSVLHTNAVLYFLLGDGTFGELVPTKSYDLSTFNIANPETIGVIERAGS